MAFRERPLTENELRELRSVRTRHARQGLGEVFFATWGTAVLVRAGQGLLEGNMDAELTATAWTLVSVVLLWRLVRHFREWRQLGQDVERGTVLRAWERAVQTIADVPAEEFLPQSGARWTEHGRPAQWRT